jgi:hypothetical protein
MEWLMTVAPQLQAVIVSCEMLGYGSLIASRISHDPASAILARLEVLRDLKRRHPALTLYGFNLITRISNADNNLEEPEYWDRHGGQLYQLSQLLHRAAQGQPVAAELSALQPAIPLEYRQDFLRRRARNHTVNLAVLQMLAEEVFDLLVLSSDDTSPFGLPSQEKRWLAEWAERLGLNDRLLMYPGADEVGCTLLARLINRRRTSPPRFEVRYFPSEADQNVAAYEDGPIRTTVERQVSAVGGAIVERKADVWVGVNAPVASRSEWHPAFAERERLERGPALTALVHEAQGRLAAGQAVVIADVAYPNGADPALIELLLAHMAVPSLAAYAAWNTAGNAIGTALAQACAALDARTESQRGAQQRFLLHRFCEDWGYQHLVRAELRAERAQNTEPTETERPAVCARIEHRLSTVIGGLPGFRSWRIAPGSVRLPWRRLFEVDFDVRPISPPPAQAEAASPR